MKILGLTGGIGAGKSEAARMFEEFEIPVIDADRVGHAVLEPGGAAVEGVIEAFGPEILTDGIIDRSKLASRTFGNSGALARLNALTHPAVGAEIGKRIADLAAKGNRCVLIEAALHAENGKLGPGIEGLVLVTCPREERLRRLTSGRGMTVEQANARIDAQTPPETKIPLARWIINNGGSVGDLRRCVAQVAGELSA